MSLDYAKCFDNPGGAMALEIMEQAGFSPPLRQLLGHVWEHQQRYIQVQQAINTQAAIVTKSLPQGDGVCTISLNILMSEPYDKKQVTVFSRRFSWTIGHLFAANIQQMMRAEQGWAQWSAQFGLEENTAVRQQARILGVDFFDQNNKSNGATMQRRVDACTAMGTWLRRARLSNNTSRALWQSRIVPMRRWFLTHIQANATATAVKGWNRTSEENHFPLWYHWIYSITHLT